MRIKVLTLVVTLFTVLSSAGCGGGGTDPAGSVPMLTIERVGNMPAGFQVVGSHGAVQVDGAYANLGLIAKGVINIPSSGSIAGAVIDASQITPQISMTGITPVLCLRALQTQVAIAQVKRVGSTFQFTVIGAPSATGEAVQWFLFDQMMLAQKAGASNAGVQVFNDAGALVFDSNAYPMRVAAVGQIPDADLLTGPALLNAAQAGVYAGCLSYGRIDSIYSASAGGGVSRVYTEGLQITSTGAQTGAVPVYVAAGIEIHPRASSGGQILLVDVSGL